MRCVDVSIILVLSLFQAKLHKDSVMETNVDWHLTQFSHHPIRCVARCSPSYIRASNVAKGSSCFFIISTITGKLIFLQHGGKLFFIRSEVNITLMTTKSINGWKQTTSLERDWYSTDYYDIVPVVRCCQAAVKVLSRDSKRNFSLEASLRPSRVGGQSIVPVLWTSGHWVSNRRSPNMPLSNGFNHKI